MSYKVDPHRFEIKSKKVVMSERGGGFQREWVARFETNMWLLAKRQRFMVK